MHKFIYEKRIKLLKFIYKKNLNCTEFYKIIVIWKSNLIRNHALEFFIYNNKPAFSNVWVCSVMILFKKEKEKIQGYKKDFIFHRIL